LVGGWVAACAAAYLVVFELRSLALGLRADSYGVVVTNRFVRHRIPWRDIRGILVHRWSWSGSEVIPTVLIERRHSLWFSIAVYATLGMTVDQRRAVARDLATLADQNGYSIVWGSETEVEEQLQDRRATGNSAAEQSARGPR
jgi:hypothetical protein